MQPLPTKDIKHTMHVDAMTPLQLSLTSSNGSWKRDFPSTSKRGRLSGIDSMNQSRYNVVLPLGEEVILYNALSDSLIIVDKDVQNVLTTKKGPSHVLDTLYEQGFLIDDDFDERVLAQEYMEKRTKVPTGGYRGSYYGKMEFLNFIITHACNLDCAYCYKLTSPCTGQMTRAVAQKGIQFAQKRIERNTLDALFVSLYGGEPILNKEVLDFTVTELQTICDNAGTTLLVKLFTNGTLLDDAFLDDFSRFNIADIHMTFDAPESVHHQKRVFPGGRSSFDQVLRGALLVEEKGINEILRINMCRDNPEVIPLLHKLRDEGIRNAHMYLGMVEPRMDYCTHYYSTYGFPGPSDLFCEVANTAAEAGFDVLPFGIGLHFSMCAGTSDYLNIVDVDGSVYKCMSLVGHASHRAGVLAPDGHLEKTPVYEKWVSRTPLSIAECRECVLLPKCMGGCTAISWREHHTYGAPGCFTVDFHKQIYNSRPVKAYINSKVNKGV